MDISLLERSFFLADAPTQRVLVVVAHPDDPEFMAGGTIAHWTDQGIEVVYCIVTDGSKGSQDRSLTPRQVAELRRREQEAAAKCLGVRELVFLGFTDGAVLPDLNLRFAIARQIRRWRPDIVVTHDPLRYYFDDFVNHPDHRAVGEAALHAIYPTARDHLSAPEWLAEGLEPHKVRRVLLAGAVSPDLWIDIGPTLERKIVALACHASQVGDPAELAKRVRERAAAMAAGHGMEYAEAFKCVNIHR